MTTDSKGITVSKLDAARRQLQTAITLWFSNGDPVSIHTLTYAAYEIIHSLSKKKNPGRRDLFFDSFVVKDEYRDQFNVFIKRHANFFKHANKDGDAVIEFKPILTELFFLFSILGVEFCGERHNIEESAFMFWLYFHKPHLLTDHGRKKFIEGISIDHLNNIRAIPKNDFLQAIRTAQAMPRR
jgi:hypothetical protein